MTTESKIVATTLMQTKTQLDFTFELPKGFQWAEKDEKEEPKWVSVRIVGDNDHVKHDSAKAWLHGSKLDGDKCTFYETHLREAIMYIYDNAPEISGWSEWPKNHLIVSIFDLIDLKLSQVSLGSVKFS